MERKNTNTMTFTYGGKHSRRNSAENPMQSSQLMKIFEGLLKNIYWSEKALTEIIPKVVMKASSPELISSLTSHTSETKIQVSEVEYVFRSMDEIAVPKKSEDMKGLIRKVEEIMDKLESGLPCDLEIILALQKVQYYKISSYGALCSFAKTLDEYDAVMILKRTLSRERITDKRLCEIAQAINLKIANKELTV